MSTSMKAPEGVLVRLFSIALLTCAAPLAADPARGEPTLEGGDASTRSGLWVKAIGIGDSLYRSGDPGGALREYHNARRSDGPDPEAVYEISWRISRALVDEGELADRSEIRLARFEEALAAARVAVRARPGGAKGHVLLAVTLGEMAMYRGGKEKIRLSREVRAEADTAIALDPREDIAWHVLGRWNREISTLNPVLRMVARVVYGGIPGGATLEHAVACFERAIEIAPGYIDHHIELGRTYLAMGKKGEALVEFRKAVAPPPSYSLDQRRQDETRREIAQLEGH